MEEQEYGDWGQSQLLAAVLTAPQLICLERVRDTPPLVCRALDSAQLLLSTGGPAFRDGAGLILAPRSGAICQVCGQPGLTFTEPQYVSFTVLSASWAKSPLILRVTL